MGIRWLSNGGDERSSNAPKGIKQKPKYPTRVVSVSECGKKTIKDLMQVPEVKHSYLLVTCMRDDSPRIKGKYDFYLCPWKDSLRLFEEYTDALELGEVARISFEVLEMTDAERDVWLRENEVEPCE
jgi:hypothetical protein